MIKMSKNKIQFFQNDFIDDLHSGFLTLKVTVDDENYSIISVVQIDQDPNIYRITTYDNGASTHRLREELQFKNMQAVKQWLIQDNRGYDLEFNPRDTTRYY